MKARLIILVMILCAFPLCAQTVTEAEAQVLNEQPHQYLFFFSPLTEVVSSRKGLAFGGGFAFGIGDEVTAGFRLMYTADKEDVRSMEIGIFVRFYILKSANVDGLFVQLNGGAVVFARNEAVTTPADAGSFSGFISAGWRFLLGSGKDKRFFLEPAVRAGTPYVFGVSFSAGVLF